MTNSDFDAHGSVGKDFASLAGRQILIVEDDSFIALEIEEELKKNKAVVVGPAHDVKSAIKLIDDFTIEIAILDVNLHREMIFPVADLLTAKNIPIVFQTAFANPDAIQALYPKAKVLKKPTCMAELLGSVAYRLKSE